MHKVKLAIIGVWLSCLASSAFAADYLSFSDEAKEGARTLTSIQSCKRLGFDVVDRPAVATEISDITVRRGVMHGIDRDIAEAMVLDALKREQANLELISRPPEDADTVQKLVASVRENFAFWNERCDALAAGELSSRYVRRTGKEAATQERLIAAATEQIEAAARGD